MSTRPLGPPPILTTDPGPWAVVSSTFAWAGGPGRRRQPPPIGLMLSPAPEGNHELAGLDPAATVAGAGPLRILAAAREPAHLLRFEGDVLHGASPRVARRWAVPELTLLGEDRPEDDPAADAPAPILTVDLESADLPGAVEAPGGEYLAVYVREPRAEVIALVRAADRALVRWIRGARAAAWSADGRRLAIGGDWGVLLGEVPS